MFTRRLASLALALSVASLAAAAPSFAQTACAPEKLNASLDQFAREPFSAASWRQLNGLGAPQVDPDSPFNGSYAATDTWRKTTAELAPDMPELQDVPYECRMGYPLEVLNQRVGKLGKTDPYIKQWLKAQARVLKACSGNATEADTALPDPIEVKPELAQMQSDDRAYQAASVAFYGQDKTKAVQLFKAIGASNSVHKAAARYNVANLLANAKNLTEARAEAAAILADPSLASVHGITKALQGYIANLEDTAEGWTTLIDNTVDVLSKPASAITADPKVQAEYAAALYDIDFVGVRDKESDWWVKGTLPENPTVSKALVDASRKHPMVLWMMAGQSVDKMYSRAPWTMVGPKWTAWSAAYVDGAMAVQPAAAGITGPARDMIDALKTGSDDASRAALWAKVKAAADKVQTSCGDAPEAAAITELAAQATRASVIAGKFDEAYAGLKDLPITGSVGYVDIILPKLMQSVLATGNAEEGRRLRDALVTPALIDGINKRQDYDRDATLANLSGFLGWVAEDQAKFLEAVKLSNAKLSHPVLNLLPAATLRKLADDATFAPEQKALLLRAAWTRDYARGRTPKKADTEAMLAANPEVKTAYEAVKTEFPKLRADRQWTLTILRNPRFGILVNSPDWTDPIESTKRESFAEIDSYDHNDKNWWCPLETDRHLGAIRKRFDDDAGLTAVKDYNADDLKPVLEDTAVANADTARDGLLKAHAMVKAVDWSEAGKLAKAPQAPRLLTQAAIRWAKATKDGAAEALGRANQVVRYGCNWHGGHKAYSKPAQEMLQKRFADTSWAKQTPYWFDCLNNEWDDQGNKVATCKPREWPKQAPLR
ncbi:hypothetical protein [Aestuariivirga sp.]|uniref:hypothetical protein n=1 Tax=Aestuariivirga sp. TaxID=2650926 RepID=UPI0039E35C52